MAIPLLEVEEVFVARGGRTVLSNICLTVEPGDCVCVSGPNGAGKTALLKTLQFHLKPYRGTLRLGGEPVRRWRRDLCRRIAYVPQVLQVDPRIPVSAFDVALSGQMPYVWFLERIRKEHRERVQNAMEALGVAHLAERPFGLLSGGEMQKVLISRALAQPAAILLLDEPTNSLDQDAQTALRHLILRLREEPGRGIVLVTHDPSFAESVATRRYTLEGGRMTPLTTSRSVTPR